jgi:hypothetical protein
MRSWVAVIVLLAACGRLGFDPHETRDAGGDASVPICFEEEFGDGAIDPERWDVFGAFATEQQELVFTLTPDASGYTVVTSTRRFDLTGAIVTAELTQAPTLIYGTEAYLMLWLDPDDYYSIVYSSAGLSILQIAEGVADQIYLPYDPIADRHWRFVHDEIAATISMQTSPDGSAWTARFDREALVDMTSLELRFQAGTFIPVADPGEARFDNLRAVGAACAERSR